MPTKGVPDQRLVAFAAGGCDRLTLTDARY